MKIACVIPHYNHAATVLKVASGARRHLDTVLVEDDGSTEIPDHFAGELEKSGVRLIRHERNRGKGAVIRHAAELLASEGVDFMIVMDADGQHDPDDLPRFIEAAEHHPNSVVVGCRDFEHAENVPGSSRFSLWSWFFSNQSVSSFRSSGFMSFPPCQICWFRRLPFPGAAGE